MISVRGLHKQYAEPGSPATRVLTGLDFEVAAGEFVAVTGASGSGKSTLLHVLGGLDAHFEGEVQVAGVPLRGLRDEQLAAFRREKVGFVFQSFHLVAQMSALDNVQLPSFFSPAGGARGEGARGRARAMLERVGLGNKAERRPSQLSGGERQRVAIARALFARPTVLLCDEPTGNLDAATGADIIALFASLHREGLTLLAVTHEDRMSAAAQRVLHLSDGRLTPGPLQRGRP